MVNFVCIIQFSVCQQKNNYVDTICIPFSNSNLCEKLFQLTLLIPRYILPFNSLNRKTLLFSKPHPHSSYISTFTRTWAETLLSLNRLLPSQLVRILIFISIDATLNMRRCFNWDKFSLKLKYFVSFVFILHYI